MLKIIFFTAVLAVSLSAKDLATYKDIYEKQLQKIDALHKTKVDKVLKLYPEMLSKLFLKSSVQAFLKIRSQSKKNRNVLLRKLRFLKLRLQIQF